jgi:protein-disulfide isomerase
MSPPESDQGPENRSRKQRREEAREERRAAEAAEANVAARRRRLMQLGAVAAVVVVAIVVIVVATGGKGKSAAEPPAKQTAHTENTARNEVVSLLKGVPQNGNVLGNPKAPVTIQYFGDLECPICREFTLEALPGIIGNDVRSGKLKIEYKSFSTATGTAESEGAEPKGIFPSQQVAAYAAGKQNLGWYFIELFYHEQGEEDSGYVTEKYIQNVAEQVPGLELTKWQTDRADKALELQVYEDEKAADKAGFTGTPSFLIGKTGGTLTQFEPSSLTESAAFEPFIEKYASA